MAETSDGDHKWAQLCGWKGDNTELSFRIAAVREVFEETNILVFFCFCNDFKNWLGYGVCFDKHYLTSSPTSHVPVEDMKEWRTKVHNDANQFYGTIMGILHSFIHSLTLTQEFCKKYQCKPNLGLLYPYAHWITPEVLLQCFSAIIIDFLTFLMQIEKYRYDTRFYVATLPSQYTDESLHQATEDAGEVTAVTWLSPDEAVKSFKEGKISSFFIYKNIYIAFILW